jgi:Fe-S cluster biogenesis protein NfuA
MTNRSDDEVINEIKILLETHVGPYVSQHGGEVKFKDYSNGTVILEMSGACSGCASSTMTLKYGIENLLKAMIPEIENVEGMDDPFSSVAPYISDAYFFDDFIDDFDPDSK